MNVLELAALAESNINFFDGPLREFKARHHALFAKEGMKAEGEAYKFTNLMHFFEGLEHVNELQSIPEADTDAFVFVDGKLIGKPEIKGLKTTPLTLEELNNVLSDQAPLSHLHHSLMGQGLLIEVEKNAELKEPVRIVHIVALDEVAAPTILIKMAPSSCMTLIEETKSSKNNYAQVSETYAQLGPNSNLEHIQIESGTESSLQHGSTWAEVAKDASYTNFIFNLNGKLQRRNLDIKLNAPGANGQSYCLFLTSGEEHSDINTIINHHAPDTTSNQIAKGILGGNSKGVFTGKIHIHPQAQRVVSGQINRNLLLSKKAHVHSQPQLEIFADDVKCSHGSTTGQMSEEEIFYFETRGIPADKARTLLAFGFGLEVVMKIQDKKARARVESAVMTTLKEKFIPGGQA